MHVAILVLKIKLYSPLLLLKEKRGLKRQKLKDLRKSIKTVI
jgi:hypothetical protein